MVEDVERSVQGKCPVHWHGKAGGEIPTPEEVIDVVKSLIK
jgi:2-oxoglutarate ferredoxin oxidoreductase subunit alpha